MRPHIHSPQNCQRGFTLVELIMVIVIMGVIGGVVAVFMRSPIDAYFDSARRAALTDVADTAVRRMARDVRKALPNSVSVTAVGADPCLVFIPTRNGGRYREEDRISGDDKRLNFAVADGMFNMLGRNADWTADQQIRPNDLVAVYNLGIAGANSYVGDNVMRINTVAADPVAPPDETTITLVANMLFPLESGGKRFHVIPTEENVVAYVCTGGNLRRTVTPGIVANPTSVFVAGVTPANFCGLGGAILATNVTDCNFVYNGTDQSRNGLVQINLALTSNNETVSLYHEVHVNNSP
jgi:MSHA biogenesis protein MshO